MPTRRPGKSKIERKKRLSDLARLEKASVGDRILYKMDINRPEVTEGVIVELPKTDRNPTYRIQLDNGKELNNVSKSNLSVQQTVDEAISFIGSRDIDRSRDETKKKVTSDALGTLGKGLVNTGAGVVAGPLGAIASETLFNVAGSTRSPVAGGFDSINPEDYLVSAQGPGKRAEKAVAAATARIDELENQISNNSKGISSNTNGIDTNTGFISDNKARLLNLETNRTSDSDLVATRSTPTPSSSSSQSSDDIDIARSASSPSLASSQNAGRKRKRKKHTSKKKRTSYKKRTYKKRTYKKRTYKKRTYKKKR